MEEGIEDVTNPGQRRFEYTEEFNAFKRDFFAQYARNNMKKLYSVCGSMLGFIFIELMIYLYCDGGYFKRCPSNFSI